MPDSLNFEPVDAARDIVVHNYLHIFAISFLLYDHMITAGNEIEHLWKRPKTPSAYWFFLNRYFILVGNAVDLAMTFVPLDPRICTRYNLSHQVILVLNQVFVCIVLTLRIYALYGCSTRILVYTTVSAAVLSGVACWVLFRQRIVAGEQESGCHIGISSETAIRLAAAWEALFIYDSIIFALTMIKTWKGRHIYERGTYRGSVPIIQLLFRDGAIYFAVMALANLSNILSFYLCGPFLRGGLSTFASSLSVTMMSRLMLNLHETADIGIYSTAYTSTNVEYSTPEPIELDTLWSSGHSPVET